MAAIIKADEETKMPATEKTALGVWRSDIPKSANLDEIIKVTLVIESSQEGKTKVLSKRVPTKYPAPYDNIEISREDWTWTYSNGKIISTKVRCEYRDAKKEIDLTKPLAPDETVCREPLIHEDSIRVNGKAWTTFEDGQPIIYRKD